MLSYFKGVVYWYVVRVVITTLLMILGSEGVIFALVSWGIHCFQAELAHFVDSFCFFSLELSVSRCIRL